MSAKEYHQVMVLPADSIEPRFESMPFSVAGANSHYFSVYTPGLEVRPLYGAHTKQFTRTRFLAFGIKNVNNGVRDNLEIVYNLHPSLPKNKCIAHALQIKDLERTEMDRPFWRGDVVIVKQRHPGARSFNMSYGDVVPGPMSQMLLSLIFPTIYESGMWKHELSRRSPKEGGMTNVGERLIIEGNLNVTHAVEGFNAQETLANLGTPNSGYTINLADAKGDEKPGAAIKASPNDCGNCYANEKTKDLMACAACKSVYYCSKECQKLDWVKHKKACRAAALMAASGGGAKD